MRRESVTPDTGWSVDVNGQGSRRQDDEGGETIGQGRFEDGSVEGPESYTVILVRGKELLCKGGS